MTRAEAYAPMVSRVAQATAIDVYLLAGLCRKESSWDHVAWNPEPKFPWLWDVKRWAPFRKVTPAEASSSFPPKDFPTLVGDPDQEWWAQKASFGLVQIMGSTAREMGCRDPWLPGALLTDPEAALRWGALYLARLLKTHGNVEKAVSAYNAGSPTASNQASYVDPVMAFAATYRAAGKIS